VSQLLQECLDGAVHNGGFCAAALGPLAIAIFDRATTEQDATAVAHLLGKISLAHPSIAILSIVGRDCTVPDASVRNRLTSEVKNIQRQLVAAATVIEGTGFRAAAMRGAVTGMTLLLRAPHPAKTFATVLDAAAFLGQIAALDARGIAKAVDQLRVR
jgi:hypothetical protein